MKKFLPFILLAITALSANSSFASTTGIPAANQLTGKSALSQQEANSMVARIYQIRDLAKKDLNRAQKQELRNELIVIKEKLAGPVTGVYISGGALILLIILLIILL